MEIVEIIKLGREDAAWTMGYLMRKAVMIVGEPCYV